MLKISEINEIAEINKDTFVSLWLKKLEKIIKDNPNDFDLGCEIRKLI